MEKSLKLGAVVCLILAFALCFPGPDPCSGAGPDAAAGAKAVNAFGIDLYGQIRKPEGNLVFSPYSVSMTLTLAYVGARGKTESQMAKALRFNFGQPRVKEAFSTLSEQVLSAGKEKTAEINIANALWAEKTYTLLKEFLESARIGPDSVVRQLDFRHSPDAGRNTINGWVAGQTKGRIKDLIASGMISADTRLVLTNAIYFKGAWDFPFKKTLTKPEPFTLLDGSKVNVPTMSLVKSFGYAEAPELQVLEMPYKGRELSMIVLLPDKNKRLEEFEKSLTVDKIDQWIGNLHIQTAKVYLPRFKMTSDFQLGKALARLGMSDAFSASAADFSGMTGHKDLFIGECIHKAFVEANEEGTEAAAATAVVMPTGMAPTEPPPRIPIFRADHPFLFLIRHKPSGSILFIGRVTKP